MLKVHCTGFSLWSPPKIQLLSVRWTVLLGTLHFFSSEPSPNVQRISSKRTICRLHGDGIQLETAKCIPNLFEILSKGGSCNEPHRVLKSISQADLVAEILWQIHCSNSCGILFRVCSHSLFSCSICWKSNPHKRHAHGNLHIQFL